MFLTIALTAVVNLKTASMLQVYDDEVYLFLPGVPQIDDIDVEDTPGIPHIRYEAGADSYGNESGLHVWVGQPHAAYKTIVDWVNGNLIG